MHHKKIEESVLKVYRKVSPSFHTMSTRTDVLKNEMRQRNIMGELGLPEQFFRGKRLIDIGGGTGEKSLFYALWGAEVTLVDANEISCARAVTLFKKFKQPLTVLNTSLFELSQKTLSAYDIVVCDGVLNHTYDPMKGLQTILSSMREGAVAIIVLSEYYAWFKRLLQRNIVRQTGGNDEKKITQAAKKYFQEHLDRAVKYGLRSEESVIYDSYVNPQDQPTPLAQICKAFYRNNVRYVSAYPTLNPFFQTHPWSQERVDKFNYPFYRAYYEFLEQVWMTSGEEPPANVFSMPALIKRVTRESRALRSLEKKVKKGTFKFSDLAPIQRGYMGIGLSFFVGVKRKKTS